MQLIGLLLDALALLFGADLQILDGAHGLIDAHTGVPLQELIHKHVGDLGRDDGIGMAIGNLHHQAQTKRGYLTIIAQNLERSERVTPTALFVRSHELAQLIAGDTVGHALDDERTLQDLNEGVQILGGTHRAIDDRFGLKHARILAKHLHAGVGLVNFGLAEGVNQGRGEHDEEHHHHVPDSLAQNQKVVVQAALRAALAVAAGRITAIAITTGVAILRGSGARRLLRMRIHIG